MRDATVVGHSLGGSVSVALAEQDPRLVDRVAIIDMPPTTPTATSASSPASPSSRCWARRCGRSSPTSQSATASESLSRPGFDVPDAFVEDVKRMTYTAYDESPEGTDDFLGEESLDRRMRATGKPLMVIMGAEEQIVNDPQRALDQYTGSVPSAETHLIAGAGHSPNVEKPAETAASSSDLQNPPKAA